MLFTTCGLATFYAGWRKRRQFPNFKTQADVIIHPKPDISPETFKEGNIVNSFKDVFYVESTIYACESKLFIVSIAWIFLVCA
jgi:hypothetical protein